MNWFALLNDLPTILTACGTIATAIALAINGSKTKAQLDAAADHRNTMDAKLDTVVATVAAVAPSVAADAQVVANALASK